MCVRICGLLLLVYPALVSSPVLASEAGGPAASDFEQLMPQFRAALAKADLEGARSYLKQACQPEPAGPSPQAALCEHQYGAIAEAGGQADLAETRYRDADSLWKRLGPECRGLQAATLSNLGALYGSRGKTAAAETTLSQALDLARTAVNAEPELVARIASRLGALYTQTGTPERGRALLTEALATLRAQTGANPPDLAYACNALGMVELWARAYASAESYLREAVSISSRGPGEDRPETGVYEANLATVLYFQGHYDRAEVLLHRARYIIETRLGSANLQFARVLADLAAVETALGEFAQAEADGRQSLAVMSGLRGPDSLEIIADKVMLGTLFLSERKTAEAASLLPEAVAAERRLAARPDTVNPRVLADGIRRLGQLRAQQGNWREAQPLYREAIAIYESNLGAADPALFPVLMEYANVLKHNGAPRAEVKSMEARAKAIRS